MQEVPRIRSERSTEPAPLPISRSGIVVAEGYGLRLHVHRGVLRIEDADGPNGRRAELIRSTSRGMRVILLGRAGTISVEAFRWMTDAGVGFALIDAAAGRVVAASDTIGTDSPRLRRLQALAADQSVGLEVAKSLVRRKLTGQLAILGERFPTSVAEGEAISASIRALETADDVVALRSLEADGANSYWNAWRMIELRFARKDEPRIPAHWRNFPSRRSWIAGTGPRSAGCAVNALLNLGYALGELEARLACLTMGLDPGLGVLHTDQAARDSLALDVLEAIRPDIDRWVLDVVGSQAFRKSDFYETRRGVFRVGTDLARAMSETLPTWRRLLAPIVEGCAMAIASCSDKPLRVATKLTESRRGRGRGRVKAQPSLFSACRSCGLVLEDPDRALCDECLAAYDAERVAKLAAAGSATLAAMRASAEDPAHSASARRKRAEASRKTSVAMRAWEREHGKGDAEKYELEVLPAIRQLTVPQLMKLTGLSQFHCWKVRKGERRLHARHWRAILALDP
jgi:CRISPR-associated endonuclease Cas1